MGNYGEYGNAGFGDIRLSKRFERILEQLASDPPASVSAACKDPYQSKAVYRFLGNDGVTTEAIVEAVRNVTMGNINAAKPDVVLVVQDTTEVNYGNLKATNGLGTIGYRETARGIELHSAIAVGETGEIYGLLGQKHWTRPPENFGQADARVVKLPIEEKESYKWLETMEKIGSQFPEGTMAVHVCDREGDIFELFCKAEKENVRYLCRRCQNRVVEEENGARKLNDLVNNAPVAGTIKIHVPRDSHTKRKARNAVLEIKFGKCEIRRPDTIVGKEDLPKTVEAYFVSAVEKDAPEGIEGIQWQLITDVPTGNYEEAVTRIAWYTQRWKIETFHRTLKSGCKVEELQYDTAEKLMKLIAIYSIISLQIMLLTYIARSRPDESCEICLTEEEWKILYRSAKRTRVMPENPPTIYEAVVMIAKLGGFPGRKSDGFPGVTVIWRGLTCLYTVLDVLPFVT